jgi:hypothetical protein
MDLFSSPTNLSIFFGERETGDSGALYTSLPVGCAKRSKTLQQWPQHFAPPFAIQSRNPQPWGSNMYCMTLSLTLFISCHLPEIFPVFFSYSSRFARYTVKSSSIDSQYTDSNPEFSVERRYSDFVSFHKELGKLYPGAILPPLPKDQVFGRFKTDFIDSRMRALDDFLARIHDHPDIASSSILKTFLSVATFDENAIIASVAVSEIHQNHSSEDEVGAGKSTSTVRRSSWLDKLQAFNPTLVESQVPSIPHPDRYLSS